MNTSMLYELALGMIPGIGCQNTKQLISYCSTAERVFSTPKGKLMRIPGIGEVLATAICNQDVLKKAEEELLLTQKKDIDILFYTNKNYPERLRHFPDSPALLYYQGNADINTSKTIGIVGTRQATEYGIAITEKIIKELASYEPIIVSGLAYGIDIHAHSFALQHGLQTIGVMASGIDIVYPSVHREIAERMKKQGGLITEYSMKTKPDPSYFPARNRIVAGLCDAIIVVEAASRGGALITAEIANSYNREVFAVPGNLGNKFNEGCNHLIKTHKAHIYTSVRDIEYLLNWDIENKKPIVKKDIFELLSNDEEKHVVTLLASVESIQLDDLSWKANIGIAKLSSILLNLEFNGFVKSLPGKKYKLVT